MTAFYRYTFSFVQNKIKYTKLKPAAKKAVWGVINGIGVGCQKDIIWKECPLVSEEILS